MVLGVTGGIATGKSSVASMFATLGATVVSADELSRQAVAPGTAALAALAARFGPDIISAEGSLDRPALSAIVFTDAEARADLNRITHPAIGRLAEEKLQTLKAAGHHLIIYEVPLLFEASAESRVDQILVVITDPETQLERLIDRDGIDQLAASARVSAQMPLVEKVRRADYLIDNSGSTTETAIQVEKLFLELTKLSKE